MKNKKNKKNSPNRLTCQISGKKRMSNKTYIQDKADKNGVTFNVWASFYINKFEYKKLVEEVIDVGFEGAANQYGVDVEQLKKWLSYNGRGAFVKIAKAFEDRNKEVELAKAA